MSHTETHSDYGDERVGFLWRCAYLLGPIGLTALIVGVIYLFTELRVMNEILIAGGASLLGAGTTVVFGKAVVGSKLKVLEFLGTWDLAFIVMYVNAVSAWWYAYNLDLLQKLPKVGPYMRNARKNAVLTLQQRPWIRRWAVVGVGAFVITPLPGSGALGGCLMGRILGISKKATFLSVAIAGVVVSISYALLAAQAEELLNKMEKFAPPWVRIAVAVVAALVMIWIMSKLIRWFASHPPEEEDGTGSDGDTAEAVGAGASAE